MIADKLTPELVRKFHEDLLVEVDAELITIEDMRAVIALIKTGKNVANISGAVGEVLHLLNQFEIFDVVGFLESTAVTVPLKNKRYIYVPWIPGDPKNCSLPSQVEVLCHEAQHMIRANQNENWLIWYLASFATRCTEERIAFQTSLELCQLLHGKLPLLQRLVGNMDKYFLRPTDEEVLIAGLAANVQPIEQGGVATEMGKFAKAWFGERIKDD